MTTIAPCSIALGPIPFSIYTTDFSGGVILFCRAGFSITGRHKEMLERRSQPFYIPGDDIDSYLSYSYQRLKQIIGDEKVRMSDKAEILHSIGKRTVEKLLEDPRSGEAVKTSGKVVDSYADFVLKSPEAANHLFALSAADAYTFSHSVNVCTFCLLIGEAIFGPEKERLWELGMAGLMHDVGKTKIDPKIIFKPGKLTDLEMEIARRHTLFSHELISQHPLPEGVAMAGRSHHERMDGSGYPDGLKGDNIHHYACIAAVADVYDAITSERVYKRGKPHIEALREMAAYPGSFERTALEVLVSIVLRNETLIQNFCDKYLAAQRERVRILQRIDHCKEEAILDYNNFKA